MNRINVMRCLAAFSLALSAAARPADTIEEIIVTADFRERPLSEVAASVTIFGAEQIDGRATQHFEELINFIPNLNWSGDGHRARYFQVRGVGELEQYQGAPNPSVGFLVDDIDFSGIGTVATLFDVARIEVLRGPQGLRYGANALAGLIYMRSAAPNASFQGHAELTVGADEAVAGGIAFGDSLTADSRLRYRLSAHRHRSNGFRHNSYLGRDDTNGRDETTVRGRLHWDVRDDVAVEIAAMFADIDNGYDAFALDNGYEVLSDKPGRDAQQSTGASARIEYSRPSGFTLTSITAVAVSDIVFDFDADWGNEASWAPVTYDYVSLNDRRRKTLSQELRLAGDDWLVGVYALRLDDDLDTLNEGEYYDPFFDFADSLLDPLSGRYDATNVAMFGQFEFALGEGTRLSVGLRGERRTTDYIDTAGLELDPSDSMWGGDLTLSHDFSESLTGFAGLSRGYKAGGFNLGIVPDDRREFAAEALWNFEAGVKAGLLEGRLEVSGSAFVNRRVDQQVRASVQLVPGDPASFVFLTVNADRGGAWGLEADVRWLPSEDWMLYAAVGTLDATFEQFTERPDLEDRSQAHAPKYSVAAGVRYTHPSGWFARADVTARDAFFFDVSHDQKSEAYTLVNARAGFETETWSLQLWVRNAFDEDYAVRGFYFGNEPPNFPDTLYVRLGDPRQLGITYERKF